MNQKKIGMIIIAAGLLLSMFVYLVKVKENTIVDAYVRENGSCFLEDGTCLHASVNSPLNMSGWVISMGLIILGLYLVFFDKTQRLLAEHQLKVSNALMQTEPM